MEKQAYRSTHLLAAALAATTLAAAPCRGEEGDKEALAKKSQNPVADLISVPFQNNTNFGFGPHDRTQNLLNIQPVIPVNLKAVGLPEWNVINRTIMPLVYQPTGERGGEFGLGDINHSAFLSPAEPGPFIWGVGPIVSLPTSVNDRLGPNKLSFGPTAVGLLMPGRWVLGMLVNNLWSVAGDSDTANVNTFLLQYFINYNFRDGWYLTSSPIVTADWKADSGDRWTVPIGAGFGKIIRVGQQPLNLQIQGFWNAEAPDGAADTTLRIQLTFLFPR